MKRLFLIATSFAILSTLIFGPVSSSRAKALDHPKKEIVKQLPSLEFGVVMISELPSENSIVCIETIHYYGFLFKDANSFKKADERCNGPPN